MKKQITPTGGSGRSPAAQAAVTALRELTHRDLLLLHVLYEHQVLTADQIARFSFPSLDRAQQRLRLLTRRGILERFRTAVRPGSQAWRYTLAPLGAAIVAADKGLPLQRPAVHAERVLRLARSPRLDHLLGVNEVFIALAHHARQHAGQSLTWWLNEQRATALCAGLARPDGFGVWTHQHPLTPAEVSFFLEYDTGTEPLGRLVDKLPGYAEARLGGGPDHPVLFWLPSTLRESHLHQLLAQVNSPILVATTTTTLAETGDDNRSTSPADRVWLVPGEGTRRHLIDLRPATSTRAETQGRAA